MRDEWGCERLSLKEELALPGNIKEARHLKILIVSNCDCAINLLKDSKRRAYQAPENGDDAHLELMRKMLADVKSAYLAAERAFMIGRHVKGV